MARDVRDVATLLHVLTHDPSGAGDETAPGLLPDGEVRGLRVGFSPDFGFIPVMPGIVQLVREGLESLQRAGVTVDDVDVRLEPYFEMFAVATSGYGRFRADERPIPYVRTTEFEERCRQPENFEKLCAYTQFAMSQPAPTAEQYSGALAYREQLVAQFDALFARYDILVSPTMHVTAPAVDDGWDTPYPDAWMGTPFTAVGNLLRLTAASYPVGLLDGLPVGLQVIGRSGDEARVLQVCRALEIARPWTARPPIAG
jgi:Asp-tRNA(Asn)/Glu-tRNA(Gln) amidotransferase A subunit family amidase